MASPPDKFYRAKITKRVDLSDDLWIIRVQPGGDFRFTAGRYATLGCETPEKLVERAYSIASSPYENEIEFFLELVPQGELTPHLHKLQPGNDLSFRKVAKGRFTLDTKSGRTHHLLLCTVTGIAPFVSYVRTLYRDWKDGKFTGEHKLFLIEGASRSWEFGYQAEMETIVREVPWLIYIPTVSRPWEDTEWKGETGRVEDVIRKYTDQWSLDGKNTSGYLCGHPEMIEHGKGILLRRGWQKDSMKEEVYFIPGKTVGPSQPTQMPGS